MDERVRAAGEAQDGDAPPVSMSEIFWYFLKLGWLAFGGPIGQIGLMHLAVVAAVSPPGPAPTMMMCFCIESSCNRPRVG